VIDEVIVTSTYGAILQKIAELPLSSAEIVYNKKVVSIEGSEDGRAANRPVILRTADGSMYTFDEVVLTTPLGWLKRNKSAFSPSLPPRISQAIDNVSVGHLEKVRIEQKSLPRKTSPKFF
jgi:monoamine oxidase